MAKSSTSRRTDRTAEEIGFLAGGPGRAAEAALARLMDGGLVRVSREGLVTAVHQNGHGATTRIEGFILTALNGAGRPIGHVVGPASHSQEMGSLRQSLTDRAMIRRHWGRASGGRVALRALLFVLGFVFLVAAIAVDRNLLLVAVVALVVAILLRRKKMLTPQGKGVLGHARLNPRDRVDAVALYGLRGVVGRQRVCDLFDLPPQVVFGTPVNVGRRKSRSDSGGGCGGGYYYSCGSTSSCSSSSCSSNSCNSTSSCGSSGCGSSSSCSSSSSCGSSSSSCSSSSSSCSSSSSSCSSSSS